MKTIKRYWIMDIRTGEEFVTDGDDIKEVSEKTGIPKKYIRIEKVYRRKREKSDLVLIQ